MDQFKVIIVEDVLLELKGTLGILKSDIPEAEVIGTAENEPAYWKLLKQQKPDLVLLDLGLSGSTTVGVSSRVKYSTRNSGWMCWMPVLTALS